MNDQKNLAHDRARYVFEGDRNWGLISSQSATDQAASDGFEVGFDAGWDAGISASQRYVGKGKK